MKHQPNAQYYFNVHYYGDTFSYMFRSSWVIIRETYNCIIIIRIVLELILLALEVSVMITKGGQNM
jgi:hypothetical protein